VAVLCVAGVGQAEALEAELSRYYGVMKDICRTGVTPAIASAYDEALRAVERARAAGVIAGNFAGLKNPEQTWLDCVQSPGDGKQ
jgi:hypothetical protein